MEEFISKILLLSFIAAVTPGPLMALLISETLKHGKTSGLKIAITPFFADLPIMLIGIFVLSKLENINDVLGIISLFGACYLLYLAYGCITTKNVHLQTKANPKSFTKGIIANFLNPNPYIFYFSILAPIIIRAMKINPLYAPLSVVVFLGLFVLIMIIIVLFVHTAKAFFNSQHYVYVIRALGLILAYFALSFFYDGLRFLKIIY